LGDGDGLNFGARAEGVPAAGKHRDPPKKGFAPAAKVPYPHEPIIRKISPTI
jgi:hypothetical protein